MVQAAADVPEVLQFGLGAIEFGSPVEHCCGVRVQGREFGQLSQAGGDVAGAGLVHAVLRTGHVWLGKRRSGIVSLRAIASKGVRGEDRIGGEQHRTARDAVAPMFGE